MKQEKKVWYAPNKFESYGEEEIKAVEACLRDGWLAGFGPRSIEFEEKIAKCNSLNITTSSIPTSVNTNSAAPATTSSISTTNRITVIEINDDNNTGVIVGSVIGGLGGLTLITILFYFLFLKLKKRQTKIEPNGEQEMKKV